MIDALIRNKVILANILSKTYDICEKREQNTHPKQFIYTSIKCL